MEVYDEYRYRFYDYRCKTDVLVDCLTHDSKVVDRIRWNIIAIPLEKRTQEEEETLSLCNFILHTQRLFYKKESCYKKGYRKNREPMEVCNYIISNNTLLIIAYEPSRSCCVTAYNLSSEIGQKFISKFHFDLTEDMSEKELQNKILRDEYELESPSHNDKMVLLGIVLPRLKN